MIAKTFKGVPLLQIDNQHTPECGPPPTVDAAEKFVSYFENAFGEQWVLVGDRSPYQRPFELVGQECQITVKPSETNGYRLEGNNLILNLITQSANELAGSVFPKEGLYELRSFPALRIQVKKTFMKDQAGNVVNTIG